MAISRHFKASTDSYGFGYFGYIEDGQLVLGENWPREGGVTYRGPYATAGHELADLHIGECCRGKRTTCFGYKWRFLKDLQNMGR